MILKKFCFSDLEILEIYGHVSHEEYTQEPSTQVETHNTENNMTLHFDFVFISSQMKI